MEFSHNHVETQVVEETQRLEEEMESPPVLPVEDIKVDAAVEMALPMAICSSKIRAETFVHRSRSNVSLCEST
jgi:hypothetical protein